MPNHDPYCIYYGTQLKADKCVDCNRIADVRRDTLNQSNDTWDEEVSAAVSANSISLRNTIYTDVENFYDYWADEMSSDAHEWIRDILDIIKGIPYNYPKDEE